MTDLDRKNFSATIAALLCFVLAGVAASAQTLTIRRPKAVQAAVSGGGISKVGIFREGFYWLLDVDGNMQWDSPPDVAFAFGGVPGDIPITGDWNGTGYTNVGIYRPSNGLFILDSNGDDQFDAGDSVYNFLSSVGGPQPGDIPVVGDWSGSGTTKVGIFRAGFEWILDYNGDGVFDQGDVVYQFGGTPGDIPVVGDWTGSGTSKIGIVRDGFYWILDANGNGSFDGTGPGEDLAFAFGGVAGDVPVVGDWTGDGVSKVGMFRDGFFWVLDANDPSFNGGGPAPLIAFAFGGVPGDVPVVGNWLSSAVSVTWYTACWQPDTFFGVTGNFQAIDFSLITSTPVTVQGSLFFTSNCDPSQGGFDNMNDYGALTGSGHWVQGFTHYPNLIPSSAVYWVGARTANGMCPPGVPCSGCVSYTASTISCDLAP